jgi:hypothetical protein
MATRFVLPHIEISRFTTTQEYLGQGSGGGLGLRERAEHGRRLQNELRAALAMADAERPSDGPLGPPAGTILEVELRAGTRADALDLKSKQIVGTAAKVDEQNGRTIALFVPDSARPALDKIVEDYLNGPLTERGQNPPNQAKVEAIENFRVARLETLWTDDPRALPRGAHDQIWWALWCWRGSEVTIDEVCARLNVRAAGPDKRLYFPELVVIPVLTTRATIELMTFATGAITELRRASDTPVFFTGLPASGQLLRVEDLAERIQWPPSDAGAVCLLDTGVNRAHPLIEPALASTDMHAVDAEWGPEDHDRHGTAMAGMALHGDLVAPLSDTAERVLQHRLESVKILPPRGFDPTDPHSYGPLTQAAIALPEISAPGRHRVYCMAVTNQDVSGRIPSAWSAAVDQAAAATMIGDEPNAPKRLIVLPAGNIEPHLETSRLGPQDDYAIEDPAQAWNAITVGGYTDLIEVREEGHQDWTPLAAAGELSPHSRTSVMWPRNAPIKPEIVLEAGNRASKNASVLTFESLSLLTTGHEAAAPLVPFDATSAAAAQAARLAARLGAAHPEFWPETIRGLIVHSAEWTAPMLGSLKERVGKRDRYELIRRFGYGVPDFDRASASANSHVALFSQSELQPFKFKGGRKYGFCHYYSLPIPSRLLEELDNEEVELKITLSYFIDPNPGMGANVDPERYRSHGLRFDLRRKHETQTVFRKRVNASEREDSKIGPASAADDDRWMLGPQSIFAGSLHCDTWIGPAVELLQRDTLCIKPVGGWCQKRSSAEACDAPRRYALIVTLKSQNTSIDLYTSISNHVEVLTGVETLIG